MISDNDVVDEVDNEDEDGEEIEDDSEEVEDDEGADVESWGKRPAMLAIRLAISTVTFKL